MPSSKLDESNLSFATVKDLAAALKKQEISAKDLANFFL